MSPRKSKSEGVVRREPALTIGTIAALLVALAGIFGIVIEPTVVEGILVTVVPIITAILTRNRVTPV